MDERLLDADWLKRASWDLPTDADEFLRDIQMVFGTRDAQDALDRFRSLPANHAMPRALRETLVARGLLPQPEPNS